MKNNITLEQINSSISIVDFISETYELDGRGNRLTAKDRPSLTVYVDQNTWWWFSKDEGSSVIDWYAHLHSCDVSTAIRELRKQLGGGDFTPRPKPAKATQPQVKEPEEWQDKQWQANTRRMADQSQERLHFAPEAQEGRDYLLGRGINSDTWAAFELGFAMVNNPNVKEKMPAIVMPWQREKITGLEFRFLTDDKKNRISSWGKRYLFGLNRLSTGKPRTDNVRPGESDTVLFIEGPINAMSVYQAAYSELKLDVVSYGAQGRVTKPEVVKKMKATAKKYDNVIIWADEADIVVKAKEEFPRAYLIKSPGDLDANDLLKSGLLLEFLRLAMEKQSGAVEPRHIEAPAPSIETPSIETPAESSEAPAPKTWQVARCKLSCVEEAQKFAAMMVKGGLFHVKIDGCTVDRVYKSGFDMSHLADGHTEIIEISI